MPAYPHPLPDAPLIGRADPKYPTEQSTANRGVGVINRLPMVDMQNPSDLEAWFGNFGFADHFRKIVLSSCKEIERAKSPTASEAKLDTLAHINDLYVDFMIQCLNGRRLREQNVLSSMAR